MPEIVAMKKRSNSRLDNSQMVTTSKMAAAALRLNPSIERGLVLLDANKTITKAKDLEAKLRYLVDSAVKRATSDHSGTYQAYLAGLSLNSRPIGTFLFLGSTATGKTRAVEATAAALLGNPRAVTKIACGDCRSTGHEVAKLVGLPSGYPVHRETHPLLAEDALNQYQTQSLKLSLVLFDEIEKASDALWNLLLRILDNGTLTLADNQKGDFSKTLIFMTSNIDVAEMSLLVGSKPGFGGSLLNDSDGASALTAKLSRTGVDAARRRFTPEFLDRLDRIVVFKALGLRYGGRPLKHAARNAWVTWKTNGESAA